MSLRVDLIDSIITDLEADGTFKKIYKNIGVHWEQVRNFPAISVIYESERKASDNLSSKSCKYIGNVEFVIYNKQPKNKFDDILSDLIDVVYKIVDENHMLNCDVLTADIAGFKRDGGTAHPYSIAIVSLRIKYKLTLE